MTTSHGAPQRAPLLHLADRVLNRPLLLHPDKALVISDVLAGRIGIEAPTMTPEASRFYGTRRKPDGAPGILVVDEGVAIITIEGSLVNRGAWVGASSGLTSYEGIAAQLTEAAARDDIKAVILDVDSPGGEAGGTPNLGAQVRALRDHKPVVAVVNDMAASAAYWIASQASEIVVSETGAVGSIGVIAMHVNRAGEMVQRGLSATIVKAGAHKADGHPFGPLSEDVRADWQSTIDTLYGLFCRAVGEGRGEKLTADAARATEARVLYGRAAIKAGLADKIGSFEATLAELKRRRPARANTTGKGTRMSVDTENTISAEAHASALTAARAEGKTEGEKAGASTERARIKAILTCEAAAERPTLARTMALDTDMTADAAGTILAAAAKETGGAPAAGAALAQREAAAPQIGGDGGQGSGVYVDAKGSANAAAEAQARQNRVVEKLNAQRK